MTTPKGEATRARILDAAADLLIAGNGLNVDELLERTRTSKGQLFHYFPDGKNELLRAAAERHISRMAETDTPVTLATWPDWERWTGQIMRRHKQQQRDDVCEFAALAGRALDTDRVTRDLVGGMYGQWVGQLHDQLAAMQREGLLRADAPITDLASAILAAIQGGAVIDKATGSHEHLESALRQALVLLRTYAP